MYPAFTIDTVFLGKGLRRRKGATELSYGSGGEVCVIKTVN